MSDSGWQLEMGARVLDGGRVRFRVFAPDARSVEVELYPPLEGIVRHAMARGDDGIWCAELDVPVGTLYRYRLDETWGYPDPYSRSQPEGAHGPSQVIDPAFEWRDEAWPGLDPERLVFYELHAGTYTQRGTFDALIPELDRLRDLGVTAIELMPICEFAGKRNWGYDGAHRFAPESSYGGPEALRGLVNAAHSRGLGVVLDVVYNHLGPDGDYLHVFVPNVLTDRYHTPWGKAINFDGPDSLFVRQYFLDNVRYWKHEFHIDGFRIDAAHEIYDGSDPHILRELGVAVHEEGPARRRGIVVVEDEPQELRIVAPQDVGGYGLDGIWVDDFHHAVHVRMTNERASYLNAYQGTTEEIAKLLNEGFVYCSAEGIGLEAIQQVLRRQLVYCVQNHDQIGNRPFGTRMTELVGIELYKAAYALLLLVPGTPVMFMGDEYAATTPFLYFTDHKAELAASARAGRRAEFRAFWASRVGEGKEPPDAQAESTLLASKLDLGEREHTPHIGVERLFREVLALRRDDTVFRAPGELGLRARAVSADVLLVERWENDKRRLIVVNFGERALFTWDGLWEPVLSTADERFAGPGADLTQLRIGGATDVELPAESTTVWQAVAESAAR